MILQVKIEWKTSAKSRKKHSRVVNAIAHQAVFQNAIFYFGKHTQGFPLRPGRFFVKVFCVIHPFFFIIIAYSTRETDLMNASFELLAFNKSNAAIKKQK